MRMLVNLKCIFLTLITAFILFTLGCGGVSLDSIINNFDDETSQLVVEETIDTIGFSLGLLAAKDPALKDNVEYYYNLVNENGITAAIMNDILKRLSAENLAYQLLARKITNLIKRVGGNIDTEGNVLSLGALTDNYLEIGKEAYLDALKFSG